MKGVLQGWEHFLVPHTAVIAGIAGFSQRKWVLVPNSSSRHLKVPLGQSFCISVTQDVLKPSVFTPSLPTTARSRVSKKGASLVAESHGDGSFPAQSQKLCPYQ